MSGSVTEMHCLMIGIKRVDLETDKLRCSKQELQMLIRSLGIAPMVEVSSRFHTLTIRSQASRYKTSTSPRNNIRIMVPYHGPEYTCYVGPKSMMQSLGRADVVASLDAKGKPLGWEDDYASQKTATYIQMNPEEVLEGLDFVLRLSQDSNPSDMLGIVFNAGEVLSTDGQSVHAALLSTPITDGPALCGRWALETLRDLLSIPMQWRLEGFFRPPETKKNRFDHGAFFFRLKNPEGVQVEITSTPREPTHDMKRGKDGSWVRAPIDEHAVCFSVASSFLQEVCSFAIKAEKHDPLLTLLPGETEATYEVWGAYKANCSNANKGSIPVIWSSTNRYATYVSLDPRKILAMLKKTTDEYVQFIVPPHPDSGFAYYEINPVYLNTNPRFFAVLSQILRGGEEDRLRDMMQDKVRALAKKGAQ
jgi:hypothetical protein